MIKHIITLIWNKRKQNLLLFFEVVLAFFILFAVYTFVIQNLRNYQAPLGFETDNRWQVDMDFPDDADSSLVADQKKRLLRELQQHPQVLGAGFIGGSIPYDGSTWRTGGDDNGFLLMTDLAFADEHYAEAAGLNIVAGRWFNESDRLAKTTPIVITKSIKDNYFPDRQIIDSILIIRGENRVVGIIDHYKYGGAYDQEENITICYEESISQQVPRLILNIRPNSNPGLEVEINKLIASVLNRRDFSIHYLENRRARNEKRTLVPMIGLLSISAFLVINISLGLFGVLWYNINKRRSEIGLRRAVGATPPRVSRQFVGEVLAVAILGIILGAIFSAQVPLLITEELTEPINYFLAIAAATLTIIILVLACAYFPSQQAARIQPAIALHEE